MPLFTGPDYQPYQPPNAQARPLGLGLPEQLQAKKIEQAARSGYSPEMMGGIGLTETPSAEAPQMGGGETLPTAAAGGAAPQPITADEPLVDYKKDPFGAIGLLLSNVAAGMRGDELPTTTLAEARFKRVQATKKAAAEEIAAQFQQAKLGFELFDALAAVRERSGPEAAADMAGRFGHIRGMENMGKAVEIAFSGKIDRLRERVAAMRENLGPKGAARALALLEAGDTESVVKMTDPFLAIPAKAAEAGAVSGATAAGQFAAEDEAGRSPGELAYARIFGERTAAQDAGPTPAEAETATHNRATEQAARDALAESRRASIAALNETSAHNIATEDLGRAELTERAFANVAAEERGQRQDKETERSNRAREAQQEREGQWQQAARMETQRHNLVMEGLAKGEADIKSGDVARKNRGTAQALDMAMSSLASLVGVPDEKGVQRQHPGFTSAVGGYGPLDWNPLEWKVSPWPIPGTARANFTAELETFKAQTFIPMVQQMVNMGALSDAEGAKLVNAAGALDVNMGEQAFLKSANKIMDDLRTQRNAIPGVTPIPDRSKKKKPGAAGAFEIEPLD